MQIVGRISYFRDRAWINVIFIKKNGSPLVPFKKKKNIIALNEWWNQWNI